MFSDVKSLFSRNMNNFDIAAENTVRIAASKNSSEEIDFCLQPLNGKVVIRASDIAGNYSTPYDPHIENTSVFCQALDRITIQARDGNVLTTIKEITIPISFDFCQKFVEAFYVIKLTF